MLLDEYSDGSIPSAMPVQHPSLGVAQALLEREKRRLRDAEKSALHAYAPSITVAALRMADTLDGKGAAGQGGRANLERFMEALEFLETKRNVKLGFMQKQLMDIAKLILVPRMFGDSFAAEQKYLRAKIGTPSSRLIT